MNKPIASIGSPIWQIYILSQKVELLEKTLKSIKLDMKKVTNAEIESRIQFTSQSEQEFGMYTALCIETTDPWKFNRVRFFCPLFNDPSKPIKSLPWASPITNLGGFDDSGGNWIPPAGSTLCLIFEGGMRNCPYYIGTTWARKRKKNGEYLWNINIEEYYRVWAGHRHGYLAGPNDESQVLPPWNTESYDGFDLDSIADFNETPEAQKETTVPNICGFKSNEKHMLKLVDGDPKKNRKHKRVELLSGCGNWMLFKDDHRNPASSYTHPQCGDGGNPFFKHRNECRPYRGPLTPQNNKCALPQSGIQLLSISGHTMVLDDSVDSPKGHPVWERSLQAFDFGESNRFTGKLYWKSATGHTIEMSDVESAPEVRGEQNYIRLKSARGNKIELNDHTIGSGCGAKIAGASRGITMQTTSNHTFHMIDHENEQSAPCRREGGVPVPKAKKAYIRIRSGYGLQITMNDINSQEKTVAQFLQLYCPHRDNGRGPHILHMQERPSGPGLVFLRVGGNYVISTYDNMYEIVGNEGNPSSKVEFITRDKIVIVKEKYLNKAKSHLFLADKYIALLAGKDCEADNGELGPCIAPVVVYQNGKLKISDRVVASASLNAKCVSLFSLTTEPLPFIKCKDEE